ncbi:cytochrome P450 [Brevibacillus dissolubilis]|uniref:cytochrome P450 n=1 Tax=Brevibacillus dissolubilis TaxID=1844116 RepID=UPI0011177287|nr:cytochrome P450 [Brevibacillus dissolubilis]
MTTEYKNLHNPKMLNPVEALLDKKVKLDPFEYLNHARENTPIRFDEKRDSWEIFLYEDCQAVLLDPVVFSSRRFPPQILIAQSMLFLDPPRHTQLRSLVSKAFTPKMIANLAPRIKHQVNLLLDQVAERGEMDIIADLSDPIPVTIIAEMLGVSSGDRKVFRTWASRFLQNVETTDPDEISRLLAEQKKAQEEMGEYLTQMIATRRQDPQDDVLSELTQAEIDGKRLTDIELLAFCNLLLAAGSESTTNLVGNAMRCFLDLPQIQEQVGNDLSLIPTALEESLRYRPTVPLLNRVASQDVEFKGHQIKEGQGVIAWVASANRDPRKFDTPDEFRLDRATNPHLTLGHGVHFCIGSALGRMEGQLMLEGLLSRFKNFTYAPGTELQPVPSHLVHGVKSLPVRFEKR